ncbi:DEAD/DEAH box helicase [Methanocaldococcus villosus]|nr:DEAD/DEAH box helicase [Methanocaldococcus villosus]
MLIIRKIKKKDEIEIVKVENIDEGVEVRNSNKIFANYKKVGDRYKLYRCRLGDKLIQPSKVLELLKKEKIAIVKDKSLEELLKSYHLKFDYINLCPLCLIKNVYKKLIKNNKCKYGNIYICLECAIKEVKEEIKVSEELIEKFLKKFKDVDKVLSLLRIKNPLNHPELTRYDIIESSEEDIECYKIDDLNIPEKLKKILKERYNTLLPVQTLAIKAGLLEGKDLLIVSATSSGKTLIGEIAGIKNLLEGKGKMIYLTPLIALANQKYFEFKEKYNFKVSLRVGFGRIGKKLDVDRDINADIIVGTYEGIDYLIRTNKLKDVGTVVVDEIHSLNMPERGARLDGLIGRLRYLFNAQMIYLSATIGNPKELAKRLNANLVLYNKRPVPLERHIIFCKNEFHKLSIIREIVKREWNNISKYGYRGQSLIFTFSRKRAEYIARSLKAKGIKAEFYHGGMDYFRRRRVEEDFLNQKIQCVVTTAALSAGVDFPASTVILESLAMGGDWLSPSDFQQMCGRAGRKGMHELGKVYLLVEIGKKYHAKMQETEDEVAVKLLNAEPEKIDVEYSEDEEEEQILATVSAGVNNIYDIDRVPYLGRSHHLNAILNNLKSYGMINLEGKEVKLTKYGRAVAISFLYPKVAEKIKEAIKKEKELIKLIKEIYPFENVYLSQNLQKSLSKILKINVPSRFFDALEVIKEALKKVEDKKLKDILTMIIIEFEHNPEEKIIEELINLRSLGKTPGQIAKYLYENYKILTYAGDIHYYLEQLLNILDAVERIALIYNKRYANKVKELKDKIENKSVS